MEPTDKEVQKFKETLEKQHGREFSWDEAYKATLDIHSFAGILFGMAEEEKRRQDKLKESPKGFHLEDRGYTCQLCRSSASYENSWFDKYGLKCMVCQNAINKRIIPASIAKDQNSYYTKYELELFFNLKGKLLTFCLKEGLLKDRKIPGKGKSVHLQLFLLSDNKAILPPKTLLKSRGVKVMKDGEEYYTSKFWYEFVDEKLAKKIAKYQIATIFPYSFAEPIETGRIYAKSVNPLFSY